MMLVPDYGELVFVSVVVKEKETGLLLKIIILHDDLF